MSMNYGGLSQLLRAWKYNTARAARQNSEATSKATPTSSRTYVLSAILLHTLALSAVLTMAGCASNAKTILTSGNSYRWHHARQAEACPGAPDCAERAALLNRWWKHLGEAETAIGKGGDMPLQIKSLKKVEKEARKWER